MNMRRFVNYFYAIIFFHEITVNGIQNFSSHIFTVGLMLSNYQKYLWSSNEYIAQETKVIDMQEELRMGELKQERERKKEGEGE